MRDSARVASSEWPPSAKKSSWTPTVPGARPSSSSQMPAISSSTAVCGGAAPPAVSASCPGSGSARRSILPVRVSGSASSQTKAAGTM